MGASKVFISTCIPLRRKLIKPEYCKSSIVFLYNRYVDRPLLIDGYKFHLRVYVLCVGALDVFVFDRILMLLAARKYNLADLDDIHNHLTNTARAVEVADFNEALFVKVYSLCPVLILIL